MFSGRRIYQWGGMAFVLGNVLFLMNKVDEMSRLFLQRRIPDLISGQDVMLIILGQIALIIGYVAYLRFYTPLVGRFGRNALRLFVGGGILVAIGHGAFMPVAAFELLFLLVLVGMAALLLGLILFGIGNLRQPILGRWPWLPLVTGIMGFIGFILFSGEEITAVFLLFRTLFALGLVGLGLVLWLEPPLRTG
ncbi:MAG: hypothetical protein R3A44_27360 [Caldilineaceae bacterium]